MANNIKGIDCKFSLLMEGNIMTEFRAKNVTVRPNVTEIVDDLCGEDRSRLDVIVNFYEGSFDTYMGNVAILNKAISYLDLKNASVDLGLAVGFRIQVYDATAPGLYQLGGITTLGAWDLTMAERATRNMLKLPFRAQRLESI